MIIQKLKQEHAHWGYRRICAIDGKLHSSNRLVYKGSTWLTNKSQVIMVVSLQAGDLWKNVRY
ncbi:hypothetical protein Ob7_07045 [Thermosipho africanus Ob7]|nr:hypothetical protein Ob7_07045 [Thermosipho africanus Ob7]